MTVSLTNSTPPLPRSRKRSPKHATLKSNDEMHSFVRELGHRSGGQLQVCAMSNISRPTMTIQQTGRCSTGSTLLSTQANGNPTSGPTDTRSTTPLQTLARSYLSTTNPRMCSRLVHSACEASSLTIRSASSNPSATLSKIPSSAPGGSSRACGSLPAVLVHLACIIGTSINTTIVYRS